MQPKKIELSGKNGKGKFTLVDKDVFEYLNRWKWKYIAGGYAARNYRKGKGYGTYRMHRLIIDAPSNMEIDHINGNRLDNRKCNLRIVTRNQNAMNQRLSIRNTSGYKGVSWSTLGKGHWKASIKFKGRYIHLGLFNTKKEAALAYDKAAKQYFGEFAYNFERRILN